MQILRLFQRTELEHTPKRNLYQQAISRDSFHNWRTGGWPGVCSGGLLQFSWINEWVDFLGCA